MDLTTYNQRVASALFRAGLLDEPSIRQALEAAQAQGQDLGALLVHAGRVRAEDLQRALAHPATGSHPAPTRPSGTHPVTDPALAVTIRTGQTPDEVAAAGALDVTLRPPPSARASGRQPRVAAPPDSTPGGASPGVGGTSLLSSALSVAAGEDVPPGTFVGPYLVKRLIAKGGMGAVFAAEHSRLGRVVALKVLLSGEGASEEQLARFLVEARASSRLNHPNVVPVYEVGEANGVHFMTMELVSGPSLRQVVRQEGPLPPRRACALVEQTARGVAAAHHEKIIHRDLKPHNVLVAPGDVAKVMDFGLAKESDQAGQGLTVSGTLLGTPSYMAPEQAAGERVGALADVYGLGAILYECLTGKPPFEGPTLANIITKVLSQDVVPPRQVRPEVHADVETICLKALEKDPLKRYTSARALADDLARWLAGEAILARPTSGLERAARWARKRKQVLIPSVLGATALAATLGYFGAVRPWRDAVAAAERQAALEAAARTFDASVEEAGATLAALASGTSAEPDAPRRLVDAVERAARQLGEELEALEPSVRALVRARSPLLPAPALEAAAYLAHGRVLSRDDPKAAIEPWATAYAAAPGTPAGTAALAELTLARADADADEVTAALFGRREQLAPALRARLHRWRAGRMLERMELGAAAWELEDALAAGLAPEAAVEAKRLLEVVCEPWRRVTDALEPARAFTFVAGRRIFNFDQRGGVILEHDPARGLHVVGRLPPLPADTLKSGEGLVAAAATTLEPRGLPVTAFFTNRNRLIVRRGEEAPTEHPRVSAMLRPDNLRFVELDGVAGTAELVCVIGPNEGDGLFVRLGETGPLRVDALDPPGSSRSGAACYVTSFVAGPLGPDGLPRLVLGYGAWGGFDLRVFASDEVARDARAASGPLGQCAVMQVFDVTGDGRPELVTGQVLGEEEGRVGHAPPGLAAYSYDEGARRFERVRSVAASGLNLLDHRVGGYQLTCARAQGRALAVCRVLQDASSGWRRGRTWVVDLGSEPPALILDAPMSEAPGGSRWDLCAGDLDGDGDDELVVARGPKGLRALGLDGELEPRAPLVTSTPIDPDQEAVDVLRRFGLPAHALGVLRRRERTTGTTTGTEETALGLLAAMPTRSEGELEELLARSRDFMAAPERSAAGMTRGHLLRAERLTAAPGLARWEAAWGELGRLNDRVEGSDGELLGRLKRVLHLRGASGKALSKLVVDLRAPTALRSTDVHRVAIDPERGLVAHVSRRVRFWAGVPLLVPAGALRVTLDFSSRGRTWGGKCDVGLLRDLGFGQDRVEGLSVGLTLWMAGPLRRVTQSIAPGFGHSSIYPEEPEPGGLYDPSTKLGVAACDVGLPYLHGGRFRAVLEHDPETRWSRYELRDRDRGDLLLFEREGLARVRVPTNLLFAGVHCAGLNGKDFAGGNLSPDAPVILERVEVASESTTPPSVVADAGGDPATRAAGLALLAGAREVVLATYDQAVHAVEARAVPALLLQRASVLARAGDPAGALRDVRAALAGDPLAFFQAVEDGGWRFHRALAAVVAQALALELADLDAAGAEGRTLAALQRRAVAHRLRHEREQGAAALAAAKAQVTGERWPEWLAYLEVSTSVSGDSVRQLATAGRRAMPELPAHLALFWAPPQEVTDLDAWFAGQVHAATQEQLTWLQRWVAARPETYDARRLRVELVRRNARLRDALPWLLLEDLEAMVAIAPEQGQPRFDLALSLLGQRDYERGGEHLRVLARGGAATELERALDGLDPGFTRDVDWAAFRAAVLRPDDEWRAFVRALAR